MSLFRKSLLILKLLGFILGSIPLHIRQTLSARSIGKLTAAKSKDGDDKGPLNIVIVGASFAGYTTASFLISALPQDGRYRILIVEPRSHFHFTWTLPRFCVIQGHESKTFIPYGPFLPKGSDQFVRWVQGHAASLTRDTVTIRETGEVIPFAHLVLATGSGTELQLPSRVGANAKADGVAKLQAMQDSVKNAQRLVIVGGGAAGVELATDAKHLYPSKTVTLVHSRDAVMHRFGPELQAAALKGLQDRGVEVILNERTVSEDPETGAVTLRSGRKIECDLCVNCTGQKPASGLLGGFAPEAVSESGHILVKPTLQVDAEGLSHIYACGDVANTGVRNPNARSAMKQAMSVADNIALAVKGQKPSLTYAPHWADCLIKLTLGLVGSRSRF